LKLNEAGKPKALANLSSTGRSSADGATVSLSVETTASGNNSKSCRAPQRLWVPWHFDR